MAALWYIGVIGRISTPPPRAAHAVHLLIDPLQLCAVGDPAFGGDVGFELSCAFTAVAYPVCRYIERKYEDPARFRTRGALIAGGAETKL